MDRLPVNCSLGKVFSVSQFDSVCSISLMFGFKCGICKRCE